MRKTLILLISTLVAASAEAVTLDPEEFAPFEGQTITAIDLNGNRATKEATIFKWLKLEIGAPFSFEQLQEDVQALENLSIFGFIDVTPSSSGEGVALAYEFREMPSFVPYLAFRFTEENGWSIGPALSAVNLGGHGIRLSGRALFGGTETFVIDYRNPWMLPFDQRVDFSLNASYLTRDDDLNGFTERSLEITPWFARYYTETARIEAMVGYFQMDSDVAGKTIDDSDLDNFFRVGLATGIDTRDSWRDPRAGWWTEFEGILSLGDGDSFMGTVDVRRWTPTSKRTSLFLNGLLSMQTGEVGVDVPEYLQYRMGGANSIRGYDIDTLGRELFGKHQFIGTAEYQVSILPLSSYNFLKWSAALGLQFAVFGDAGIAWSESSDFNTDRFKVGGGVGLRLLVPGTEMTRFDFAWGEGAQFEFHFGNWAKWTAQRFRLR